MKKKNKTKAEKKVVKSIAKALQKKGITKISKHIEVLS